MATKKEQIKEAIQELGVADHQQVHAKLAENGIEMRLGYVKRIIRKYFKLTTNVQEVSIEKSQPLSIGGFYNPKFHMFIFDEY